MKAKSEAKKKEYNCIKYMKCVKNRALKKH